MEQGGLVLRFVQTNRHDTSSAGKHDICYLAWNNWDDFGFTTTFDVTLYDTDGQGYELGSVRIMQEGQKSGTPPIEQSFEQLGDDFCSLGNNRNYYARLFALPPPLREAFLEGLRDCVADPARFERFRSEEAMQTSLLRTATAQDVLFNFRRTLEGQIELTPYRFSFTMNEPAPADEDSENSPAAAPTLLFNVRPNSRPPSNVHVLIGRNGIGKTRILAGMANALTGGRASFGIPGIFEFESQPGYLASEFLNLVIISFSAFDRFDPIRGGSARTESSVPFYYVGVKRFLSDDEGQETDKIGIKSPEDLNADFGNALEAISNDDERIGRWVQAMDILGSDQGIRDLDANRLRDDPDGTAKADLIDQVSRMSSGHKIVLLTIARLIENASERSLVLIDEPETHLHPPLLGSFMRALSELLITVNGVAIVATHSPVVLQEVPAKCVWMLRRKGRSFTAARPEIETFAENVSVLTRKIFGLETEESGFYRLLSAEAKHGGSFEAVDNDFAGQIGAEGRALLRAFTWKAD